MPLDLQSERYIASGNIAAEGVQNLLGTPQLDRLHTLIRETVQNSGDAKLAGKVPEYRISLRRLDSSQLMAIHNEVLAHRPPEEAESVQALEAFLNKDEAWVLDISDFETCGLAGATRADHVPEENEPTDFIDFVRNIGSRRDRHLGGGTYGYGKASIYTASSCSAVLIDTQTLNVDQPVRRLIGAHIGRAYDVRSGELRGRYTGRHWWGELKTDGELDPVEAGTASRLCDLIGLPSRSATKTGTTLCILDPDFGFDDPRILIGHIQEALLWQCWPKMLARDGHPSMVFSVFLDGQKIPLPEPENFPPISKFLDAYRNVRNGTGMVEDIRSRNPSKHLGRLSIVRGYRESRSRLVPVEESVIPGRCYHLAAMRPAELVVRYFAGNPLPDEDEEWCGVFVASEEEEVEEAFAKSEPPAHDDWIPKYLPPRSRQKTFVNVALREIKRHISAVGAEHGQDPNTEPVSGLAGAAGKLGSVLAAEGDRVGGRGGGGGGGRGRPVRPFRIIGPEFERLEEGADSSVAVFRIGIQSVSERSLLFSAQPRIVSEGGLRDSDNIAPNGRSPELISWSDEIGTIIGHEAQISTTVQGEKSLYVRASIPDYVAIELHLGVEEL